VSAQFYQVALDGSHGDKLFADYLVGIRREGLDATKQAVRIAHGVGTRKRELIEKACDDKGLRILNRMVTE